MAAASLLSALYRTGSAPGQARQVQALVQALVEDLARAIEAGGFDAACRHEESIVGLFGISRSGGISGRTVVTCNQFCRLLKALASRPEACNALERPWTEVYLAARATLSGNCIGA